MIFDTKNEMWELAMNYHTLIGSKISEAGIDLSYLAGVAKVSLSAAGIELSYGQGVSSIVVGPAGVTIKGPLITSTADGINTVKGSLVMLN